MKLKYILIVAIIFFLAGIALSVVQISLAADNNPGHSWSEMDCDSNMCVNIGTVRIGIGTENPTSQLHVYKNVSGTNAEIAIQSGNGSTVQNKWAIYQDQSLGSLRFWNTDNRLTILSTGNVGIGTTGPDAKLDVLSTGEQLRLTYSDGSAYTSFTSNSSGNLLINNSGSRTTFADAVYFANGSTYYVDSSGNAKFLDLIAADTGNPGLTVGNGTTGYIKIGGSTIYDNGGSLTIDSDSNPLYTPDTLRVGGLTSCANVKTDSSGNLSCNTTAYLTSYTETDPQVNTLTNGKWCTSNGSVINCTSDAPPVGVTGSGTSGYVPKWTGGTSIENSILYNPGTTLSFPQYTHIGFAGASTIDGSNFAFYGSQGGTVVNSPSGSVELKIGNSTKMKVSANDIAIYSLANQVSGPSGGGDGTKATLNLGTNKIPIWGSCQLWDNSNCSSNYVGNLTYGSNDGSPWIVSDYGSWSTFGQGVVGHKWFIFSCAETANGNVYCMCGAQDTNCAKIKVYYISR